MNDLITITTVVTTLANNNDAITMKFSTLDFTFLISIILKVM